jgi:hypothetical protein
VFLLLLCSFLSFGEREKMGKYEEGKKVDGGELSKKFLAKKIRLWVLARMDCERERKWEGERERGREGERERGREGERKREKERVK